MKKIDTIAVITLAVLLTGVTAANLFQPNRPTESLLEQRTLAKVPTFSWSALADGSYFSGWSSFFSDTFWGRDTLVDLSKEMDTLMGVPYDMGGDEQFVLLNAGSERQEVEDADAAALADALDKLLQEKETDAPETDAPETTAPETNAPETDTVETTAPETDPVETTAPETDAPETTAPETNAPETEAPETAHTISSLTLSKETLRLTVGSGSVLYATVSTSDGQGAAVSWSTSDKDIATISKNPKGGIDVKAVAEGECTLTCRAGDGITATCKVVVSHVTNVNQSTDNATADFLTNGMFIYGDGVYTPAYYAEASAKYYAQALAYYQSLFGENVQISSVISPVSSMVIDDPTVQAKIADQGEIQDKIGALMDDKINFVDVYSEMYSHRDEYLFFKSDHHWTQLGAYYAYRAFAASRGFTPVERSDMNYSILNDNYSGSMYTFTKDSRVKNFKDTIEAWTTKKAVTMTVTSATGAVNTYNSCLTPYGNNYVSFIAGDNPYTVINVPENPQDLNILVFKDSFGNAFVPFLCEHYGNIIVVDVRYTDMNVYEHLKDYGLTDIVFVNNVQAALSTSWVKMYLKAVGVE